MGFGLALFALAGVLLALVAEELSDGEDLSAAVVSASPAEALPGAGGPVVVVTCPGADQRKAHPAYAAACGDRALLKSLLGRPGASDAADPRPEFVGRGPLHHAAQRGDTIMVGELLAAGADPNRRDADGHTPLHLAAATLQLRHPEFVARRLIDGGARIDLRNAHGLTPLEELEANHQRLLDQQNLAQMLFQKEREDALARALDPAAPAAEGAAAVPVLEVDRGEGRVRIPIEPPAAGPAR